jgi:hypothetical protein
MMGKASRRGGGVWSWQAANRGLRTRSKIFVSKMAKRRPSLVRK